MAKDLEKQAEKGKEKFGEMKEEGSKKVGEWRVSAQEMAENAAKKVNSTVETA